MARPRRRGGRVPSRAERLRGVAGEPKGATIRYAAALRKRLNLAERETLALLDSVLAEVAVPEQRADAKVAGFVYDRLGEVHLKLAQIFDEESIGKLVGEVGVSVDRRNKTQLTRVAGLSLRRADPGVAAMVDSFRARNVDLIKSLQGRALDDIRGLLEGATEKGLRVETLRKEIQGRFDVTRSKASLLARDQTNKLNGQITHQRQANLGVAEYIWTTSGDERVRDTHAALDGTVQRWDTPPPDTGHPGDDYQCRCTAYPVLPELDATPPPPPELTAATPLATVAREALTILETIGGVSQSNYLREGMRSLDSHRRAYAGLTAAEAQRVATGKRKVFAPIKVSIEMNNGRPDVFLTDGRHRVAAAREAGATEILARIRVFDEAGDVIRTFDDVIPI